MAGGQHSSNAVSTGSIALAPEPELSTDLGIGLIAQNQFAPPKIARPTANSGTMLIPSGFGRKRIEEQSAAHRRAAPMAGKLGRKLA